MLNLLIVEDNERLAVAMKRGLEETGKITVTGWVASGEAALTTVLAPPEVDVLLMDVALAGAMNGIEAAVAIRRELPRIPVVFYSIQDDDAYYRAFLEAGILTHYAYVRKSNYLLPQMLLPLLRDAVSGRSFVDPEIEARVREVRTRDRQDPFQLLEPNEQIVIKLLMEGRSNEQIAALLGFRDKRTISRTNGQIYAAWGLAQSATDEKVARVRATIIALTRRLIRWDDAGTPFVQDSYGEWVRWKDES
jgi:DNA-binding NarL/FixJ family response regulator